MDLHRVSDKRGDEKRMKWTKFFKNTVSIAAAAAALFTAIALPSPNRAAAAGEDQVSDLPTKLMNGDFEWPDIDTALGRADIQAYNGNTSGTYHGTDGDYSISNNDTEYTDIIFRRHSIGWGQYDDPWFVTTRSIYDDISSDQSSDPDKREFYWKTTASDDRIELAAARDIQSWNGGSTVGYFRDGNTEMRTNEAASGGQFAELVATEQSSLYQTIQTAEDNVLTWRLDHRARTSTGGRDSMAVFIGPKQDGLKKESESAQDVFSAMVDLIRENPGETTQPGMSVAARKIYSAKIYDGMEITPADVSNNKTDRCDQEWTCWIITSNDRSWQEYSGTYKVPEGQNATTFAFAALNRAAANPEGNCLDNIVFGIQYPLTVTATAGGTGTVSGGGISNAEVSHGNAYNGSANEGETVKITASPKNDNYKFVGATVNGNYVEIGGNGFVQQDGSYTYQLTMDGAKNVELIFASVGYVTYDLNGGTWDSDIQTSYKLDSLQNNDLTQINKPALKGSEFLYWEVYAANGTDSLNGEVDTPHTIKYTVDEGDWWNPWDDDTHTFTITDSSEQQVFKIPDDADEYAIVLRAVYTHTVDAVSCTKYFASNDANHKDNTGGSVTIINNTDTASSTGTGSISVENGDSFTVTATPNEGFEVDSWWYSYFDDKGNEVLELIPDASGDSYTATYNGSRNVTIHAQFAELPIGPYLSVVAADEDTQKQLVEKGIESEHGHVTGNRPDTPVSELYGGEKYGNTISTGFFAKRKFEVATVDLSGTWSINIPANGTYFKIAVEDVDSYEHINKTPVLDNDKAEYNSGAIYKAADNTENNYNRQVQFYVDGPTVSGNSEIIFGIIVDNLYAPNAQAGFRFGDNTEGLDVLNNSNSVTVTEQNKYDPTALDNLSDTQTID